MMSAMFVANPIGFVLICAACFIIMAPIVLMVLLRDYLKHRKPGETFFQFLSRPYGGYE